MKYAENQPEAVGLWTERLLIPPLGHLSWVATVFPSSRNDESKADDTNLIVALSGFYHIFLSENISTGVKEER